MKTTDTKQPASPQSTPEVWYRTTKYSWEINAIKVERSTDSILYMDRWGGGNISRCAKHSSYEDYWPTEQAARENLIAIAKRNITTAENTISEMRGILIALAQP